jgi:hypothetical protein
MLDRVSHRQPSEQVEADPAEKGERLFGEPVLMLEGDAGVQRDEIMRARMMYGLPSVAVPIW